MALFRQTSVYLLGNVLNAGIPFLLMPVLTRVLTPGDYGIVTMFAVMLSVAGAFTGLSVHGAVQVRFVQLGRTELAEYVGVCLGILALSTAVVLLLVGAFGDALAAATGLPPKWLLLAVLLAALQFVGNIRLSLWQANGAAWKYGGYQIVQSALNAVISLGLVLLAGWAWEGRIAGQAVAIILCGSVAVLWLRADGFVRRPSAWKEQSRDALRFGLPLIPHVIGGILIVATDRFVIVEALDVSQAGIYMVALQVGQGLGLITESFNRSFAPWLLAKLASDKELLKIQMVRGTYLYFGAVIACAVVLGLVAPSLLSILVGKSFQAAAPLVLYTSLGFAFGGCYYMVTNYIFFKSKTSHLAIVTFVVGLINIPLMIWFVGRQGILGAAQAFMFTQLLSFLGTWWLAQRNVPMPWWNAVFARSASH